MNPVLQNVLSRLRGVRKDGKGWKALCPAHDDRKPSLKVDEAEDGKVLLKCFAGCGTEDIIAAIGLKMSDLYPEPKQRPVDPGRVVATYDYRDASGKLLFQVCRTADKHFFQRRPDGKGGWITGLGDVKPVLYRLPEVLQAVQRGETVFIPEGEKDVDNLARLGLAATTNPMGAGKWRDYYSDWLKDANCVILTDNDDPGRKHAKQVAQSLYGKAASVKVLELPDLPAKGDVSDWLAAGGTKEELLKLAAEAPAWEPPEQVKREKAKKEDERKTTRQTSFFVNEGTLFEQIYLGGKSLFLAFDTATGEAKIMPFIELEEEIIEPINGEDVELGAVRLPSGVEEYGDTLTLLTEIEAHIYRYLDVSPNYLKFAAYYVLLSWLYDRFNTLPYLRALGDTGCGKSRFLDVIGGLCYKAISASGCVTPAPIYRMLRKWQGTLVLDEADMKNSDEYNEVVTILNCGFERGRPVIRATKDNPDKVQILPVYGPKVFATRRRFKDVALEARCLTEIMRETDRDDIPPVLGRKFFKEQQTLRNKLLLFRLRNYFNVDPEAASSLNLDGIEPRLRQISEAFTSLFANEPEVLESYREFITNHQRELIEQRAATKTGQVVEALFALLEERGGTSVTSGTSLMGDSELVTGVSAGDIAERTGLSAQAVGVILKGLGIETKLSRRGSERKREILFNEAVFRKLRKRYIVQGEDVEQPVLSTNRVVPVVPLVTEPDREVWEI
jgi:5S rRNA maturation endonuclease (ribonuclease M5)